MFDSQLPYYNDYQYGNWMIILLYFVPGAKWRKVDVLIKGVWWLKAIVFHHYYFWLFKFGGMSKKNQKEGKKTNNLLQYFNKNNQAEDKNLQ